MERLLLLYGKRMQEQIGKLTKGEKENDEKNFCLYYVIHNPILGGQ